MIKPQTTSSQQETTQQEKLASKDTTHPSPSASAGDWTSTPSSVCADQATKARNNDEQQQDGDASKTSNRVYEDVLSFDDFELRTELLRGVYGYGFEKPSAIQSRAVAPMIGGHDLIAQAHSGSGKTGAFTIGTLQLVDTSRRRCQALILTPTRELAVQTSAIVQSIGDYMDVKVVTAIGGVPRAEMARQLRDAHVVVGTPGRMYDMINSRALDVTHLQLLVLDEADEMLSRGFVDQVRDILRLLPESVQIALFSATISPSVLDLTQMFMRDPIRILVKQEQLTLEGISQFYVDCDRADFKLDVLCDLYSVISIPQSIIFCNTRRTVEMLAHAMTDRHFTVSALHSDLSQEERNAVMSRFRSGSSRVLITTDIVARGMDVQSVSLVINFELPTNNDEVYLHRIGRCGRFGRTGIAINLLAANEARRMAELERFYEMGVKELPSNVADLVA